MVVLKPDSSARDAARAIEHNRIGAVVVQDKGRVVGIVTDRDLALRVLGFARDALTTRIADVMTETPVTLTLEDSVADAIDVMQSWNVRRVPLVTGERVVGMVTLDDLLLDEAAPLRDLAAIVQTQIAERDPPAAKVADWQRNTARAAATLAHFVDMVHAETGLAELGQSRAALDIVLGALVRRLTASEAKDFLAQLPSLLRPDLEALPPGPDTQITAASIEDELARALDLGPAAAARLHAAVTRAVAGSISDGEVEDVRGRLPPDLRELFRYTESAPLFV
jgi:uncharacterized protein (DUF2267 family)/predicted transcriptional regulator